MVLFHCESNPGYAASSHELTFLEVAKHFAGDLIRVHYAYSTLEGGLTPSLPAELENVIQVNTQWNSSQQLQWIEDYIRDHNIRYLLGFDQPVDRPAYKAMRRGGVQNFVSYWGAPMSSINKGLKLFLKKLDVALAKGGPDHYIFQSTGMRDSAVFGRGIPAHKTSIVKTGVDTSKYAPDAAKADYVHQAFDIPRDRKIVVFSGHMEKRKGVHIILQAAHVLLHNLGFQDVHFLILGNRPGEQDSFGEYLQDATVSSHVTFGGYRADIPDILKGCSVGMIASTEWDSFPMSSLEMAASGLPLIVSDLEGLNETVTDNTGFRFPVGDFNAAAKILHNLLPDAEMRVRMGHSGRERVKIHYSRTAQAEGIIDVFKGIDDRLPSQWNSRQQPS